MSHHPAGADPPRPDPGEGSRDLKGAARSDVKAILEAVRLMIRRSELSQRQVEERVGFSRGYLSQLLAQNLDLKVWHLLAILDLFDESPSTFFARLGMGPARDALSDFAAAEPLDVELAESLDRLYHVGVGSLARLRRRLERLDEAVGELERRGLVTPAGGDGG